MYLELARNSDDLTAVRKPLRIVLTLVGLWMTVVLCSYPGFGVQTAHQKVPPKTPSPAASPLPTPSNERVQHVPSAPADGSTFLLSAEWWVAFATLILCVVTAVLAWITRVHVKHFKQLVERIERIYDLQASPRIAISLSNDEAWAPRICLQNICNVPLIVLELSFHLTGFGGETETVQVPEIGSMWLLPKESTIVKPSSVADLWLEQRASSVTIECSYLDIYPATSTEKTTRRLKTHWLLDHARKSIKLHTAETIS